MAAITKRLLHLRPNLYSYPRPHLYPLHHFSSSSEPNPPADVPQSEPVQEPDSSAQNHTQTSFFDDLKASLRREPPAQDRHQTFRKPFSLSNRTPQTPPPSKQASLEEIRRNISEFHLRSAAPPPSSAPGQYVSMQELYKKNVLSMTDGSATSSDSATEKPSMSPAAGGRLSYSDIRGSLSHLKSNLNDSGGNSMDRISLARFKETLKLKPDPNANLGSTRIIGGSDSLPPNFLGKDRRLNGVYNLGNTGSTMSGFLKMPDRLDLGKKLKMLRPEKRKGKWFSLQELSERLAKVRQIEEKESEARIGIPAKVFKDSIQQMSASNDDKSRRGMTHRLDILGHLGGTPSIMLPLSPPKENLVEKYFHPDNMSSAEKLKLELKRVRDEFKMSESDCGSARVQVAQLTTKIKHLSNVLQKKDKHSRRGLQAMVQRRKKLLKYLRRTDWDSYCFVISKLGLRDNPDVKA